MEVEKHNPFVVKPLPKTKTKPKPKPLPKAKIKPKLKTKFEARGLSLENKKVDTIYAKDFVKTSRT